LRTLGISLAGVRTLGISLAGVLCAVLSVLVGSAAGDEPSGSEPVVSQPAVPGEESPPSLSGPAPRSLGWVHLEGPIDRRRARYIARAIGEARDRKLDAVVMHIDTDGGEVRYAREIFKTVLEQSHIGGPRMIAFVDYRALSAGAMVAYAHEAIYVSPNSSIGDIGVIFLKPGGTIEYAPEKIETVVRTLLAQAAEQRGWPRGLLLKMTARNQILYRVTGADGKPHFVIEDDFPDYLSRHPGLDREDPKQVVVFRGKDRLLTLTGPEALRLGMASGKAATRADLLRLLRIPDDAVVDLSPTGVERTAWWLSGLAPLLAGLAIVLLLFEFKTPGIGIWAAMAGLFGALFLMTQFSLELMNNFELVLILTGAGLLVVEVLTGAGAGLVGVLGGLVLLTGLVLGFLPDEVPLDPRDPFFRGLLADALLRGVYTVATLTAGIIAFVVVVPRSRLADRLKLKGEVTATSKGRRAEERDVLVGRVGRAREALSPGGIIVLDGRAYLARAQHASHIDAGTRVRIVGVEFGELVVHSQAPDAEGPLEKPRVEGSTAGGAREVD